MANTLMFEVGVKEAGNQLTQLENRLKEIVTTYGSLKIKVEVENLQTFVNALKEIGDGKQLKPLLDRIDALQQSLVKMNGAVGNVDMSALNKQLKAIEQTQQTIDRKSNELKVKGLESQIPNAIFQDKKTLNDQLRTLEKNFGMVLEVAKNYVKTAGQSGNASSALEKNIKSLSQSISELSGKSFSVNMGTEFKTWAEQVQALVAQVKELVAQMEKLHSVQGNGNTTAAIDSQTQAINKESEAYKQLAQWREQAEKFHKDFGKTGLDIVDWHAHGHIAFPKTMRNGDGAAFTDYDVIKNHVYALKEEATLLKERQALIDKYSSVSDVGQKQRYNQILSVYNEVYDAMQKLKQEEAKPAPQGGIFDPQKFTTLQDAIDKIISEINRLKEAFAGLGDMKGLSEFHTKINGLMIEVNNLVEAIGKISGAIHIDKSVEEIAAYEKQIANLKTQIESLQTTLKQAQEGIKMVSSGKGSEATQNTNLDTVKAQAKKAAAALEKMNAEYKRMEEAGAQNAGLQKRINDLKDFIAYLDKVKSMDLSKVGALKATDAMFNGNLLFGQVNKQMYSDKSVKEFSKIVDETIKAKSAADSLNDAFERMKQKILGVGSSANGGMRGVSAMMESITTVGERNIQTLIKERAHIERLIAVAEKSIRFGEGHDVAGMQGLRVQQRENLEYLQNVKNAIDHILTNRNTPEWMRFLNTPGSLRIPLGGSENDIALLGGHFNALTHSVTGTSQAMRQLNRDMRVDNSKEVQNRIKEQAQALKNAERENKTWADSMDYAKSKANELRLTIEKLESVKAKGVARNMDMSAFNEQIEMLRRNLQTLYAMAGGSKIFGTSQAFVGSSDYRIPLANANNESLLIQRAMSEERRNTASATRQLSDEEQRLAAALGKTNSEMRGQSQVMSDLKMMAYQYLSIWGAQQFVHNIIEIGGQLENQRRSITAILGEAAWANDLFSRIQDLSLKSPFGVVQLDQYSKQLSAYGFEYNELFEWTKRLADIAAGTGTDFSRLTLALGHVRSEMALTGYTLRQFAMGNIPLLKKLSENLGVTTSEIRKMVREKKVSYDDVKKVLEDLTNEGGMFYNMQEVISESVKSRFKNLSDAMAIMYGQMAEGTPGAALKEVAKALTEMAKRWRTLLPILASALALWGLSRVSMWAYNRGLKSTMLSTTQQAIAFKGLSAAQVDNMVLTKSLTRENLLMAVATKKLTVDQAELAAATFGVSRAQLSQLASMSRLRVGMAGAFSSVGMIANPYTAALVGFEAVLGTVSAYNAWVDNISQKVDDMIDNSKAALKEVKKYLDEMGDRPSNERLMKDESEEMKTVLKNSGLWTKEMETQVNLTGSIREEYDMLVGIMRDGADAMSKMNYEAETLKDTIRSTSNELGWGDAVEMLLTSVNPFVMAGDYMINSGNQRSGGWKALMDFFFNDDIIQSAEKFEKASSKFQSFFAGISEYKDDIQTAVNEMIRLSETNPDIPMLKDLPLEEQLRKLAQSDYWDIFVEHATVANEDFEKVAELLKDNLDDVADKFGEITEDDIPKLLDKWMKQFGLEGKDFQDWAKKHPEQAADMLTALEKVLDEKGPAIAAKIRAILLPGGLKNKDGEYVIEPTKGGLYLLGNREETEAEKKQREAKEKLARENAAKKKMGDSYVEKHLPNLQKLNNKITSEWLSEYVDISKSASDIEKGVVETLDKKKKELDSAKKLGRDTKEIEEEILKLQTVKDYHNFKNKEDKRDDKKDPWAKKLTERIKILKSAADAFQYWRKKIGENGAWNRVTEEFGKILGEIGINKNNIKNLRENLLNLLPLVSKIKDKTKRENVEKNIIDATDKLDRKEFEEGEEQYLSRIQIELDSLTRSWELFNNIRTKLGNTDLASRISGAGYAYGEVTNLADALKKKIEGDLSNIKVGLSIDFNVNMSDKDVEEEVQAKFDALKPVKLEGESDSDYDKRLSEYQEKINGIVDETKKWRDLQRDVQKEGLILIAEQISSAKDYDSQIDRINTKLAKQIDKINKAKKPDDMSDSEFERIKNRAIAIAKASAESEKFKLSSYYINIMNNGIALTRDELKNAANAVENDLNKSLQNGTITTEQFANELEKVHKIVRDINLNSFFGKGNAFNGFASGGVNGLVDWYDKAINKRINELGKDYTTDENGNYNGNDEELKKLLGGREFWEDVQKSLKGFGTVVEIATGVLNGLSSAAQSLSDMFYALGSTQAGDTWSDIADGIKGVSSVLQPVDNVVKNAQSGNISGLVSSVLTAPVDIFTGPITAFAQLHDKSNQRVIEALQKQIDAIEANTAMIKSLRSRSYGYDSGEVRRNLRDLYSGTRYEASLFGVGIVDEASKAMYNYYNLNSGGNSYTQELKNLQTERAAYMRMYNEEEDKKNSSSSALESYKEKIAELDEQIMYFFQDLAKDLWNIDIKEWADQIGDALWNAFENGEDALEAFHDTAKSIVSDVAKRMMKLAYIEPMLQGLQNELFGSFDPTTGQYKGGKFVYDKEGNIDMEASQKGVLEVLGKWLGGSKLENIADGAEMFFEWVERITGMDLSNKDSKTSNKVIQGGFNEDETGLLLSYVNAIRADVSVNRSMIEQYFPMFYAVITGNSANLRNIENHTAAIMRSNDAIKEDVAMIYSLFKGLKSNAWKMPMA